MPTTRDAQRTIQFYRMFTRVEGGAIDRIDAASLCAAVRDLAAEGRFMLADDGTEIVCWPTEPYADNRVVLEKFRVTDLPTTRTRRGEQGVIPIAEDQGLGESTHVLFFENNVIGCDFNSSGPRPTRLRDYLQDRLGGYYQSFGMRAIVDKDVQERVRSIVQITGLEVQMSSQTLHALRGEPSTYLDILKSAQPLVGNEAGVVAMRWATTKRDAYLDAPAVQAFALHMLESRDDFDNKTKLVLSGKRDSGKRETVNLLSDKVVSRQRMVKIPGSRSISPGDAFRAIASAYNEMRERFPSQAFIA